MLSVEQDKENREMDDHDLEFAKYSVLVSELRHPVLTYLNTATLLNYSQCSKYCNSEIQEFNTKPPVKVKIDETDHGIEIDLHYGRSVVKKTFTFVEFGSSEETTKHVEKYLMEMYRYVRKGKTRVLSLDLGHWPAEVMKMKALSELKDLTVYVNSMMLDDFVEYAKTTKIQLEEFRLIELENSHPLLIRKKQAKQIFQSEFFRQTSKVIIDLDCDIDDEDFIGFNNPNIHIQSRNRLISNDAIRQKVDQLNNSSIRHDIRIEFPQDSELFDLDLIFPEGFPQLQVFDHQDFRIGNVFVSVEGCGNEISMYNVF